MRSRYALVILVLVAGAYFWLGRHAPTADGVATESAPVPPKRAPTVSSGEKPRPVRVAPKVPALEKAPDEAYHRYVPFHVVDGMAVAFGDVILGAVQDGTPERGLHEPDPIRLWDDREIPYGIATTLPNPARVDDALRYLMKHTSLVFVPLTEQTKDAIIFEPGTELCLSALGKTGGRQPIRLAADCGRTEILHEVLHALGFIHEHSRPDRDQYVEVVWDNVDAKFRDQFRAAPTSMDDPSRGTPFDFSSVMLYPPNLFGKQRGSITLRSREGKPEIQPVRDGLSPGDIRRIREVYR